MEQFLDHGLELLVLALELVDLAVDVRLDVVEGLVLGMGLVGGDLVILECELPKVSVF